tara:strand:- start:484 stop:1233 length:750 start_codon:yes stop_codon:yes gene_type:complete
MEKLLEEIGLTEGESKVYLGLLKLGATKVGPLLTESGVSSSKIYKILERLERKGLVGHSVIDNIKNFKAMPLNSVVDYMKENEKKMQQKRELLEKKIPEFQEDLLISKGMSEAFVYHGFKAVKNFLYNMIETLNSDETYYVMGARYEKRIFGVRPFFKDFHLKRSEKKIKLKMLANHETKGNIEPETFKFGAVKFLPDYLLTNMHVFLFRENTFMILWSKNPIAFYIKNEDVTKSFSAYFNAFWKIAKK